MLIEEKEFRDVVGYEDKFMVSCDGEIYSKRTKKILVLGRSNGYPVLSTKIGGRKGKSILLRVHRLVIEAWGEPPSAFLVEEAKNYCHGLVIVNHKDGDKENNHISNLEWCSYSENMKHAHRTGLIEVHKGTKVATSKLSEEDVKFIRENKHKHSFRELGKIFGIHHKTVYQVFTKETYKNI